MSIALVQTGSVVAATSAGDPICALGSSVTLGNTILIAVAYDGNDGGGVPTVTDNLGNTYGLVKSYVNTIPPGPSVTSLAVLAAPVTTSGTPSAITVSMGGARGGVVAFEYSGLNNSSLLDQFDEITAASGTSLTTPGITTLSASELLFAVGASLGGGATPTFVAGSGYTMQVQGAANPAGWMGVEDQIVSSTGSYNASMSGMTSGDFNSLLLVTLKAAPAATYSISGNSGMPGATVTWSGTSSGSLTANADGSYSIPTLSPGSYTVTVTRTGYNFSAPQSVTITSSNVTGTNFAATNPRAGFSIG